MKWRKLRAVFGKKRMKQISSVEYEVSSIIIRSSTQVEMEEAIITENSHRFQLACSLPLFHRDILRQIRSFGQNTPAQDMLWQNTELEISDNDLRQFLQLLYQLEPNPVDVHISTERWRGHWKHSKEKIASSISGLHFGHYKAMSQDCNLSCIKSTLVNLAIKNSIPLSRWLKGVSIMLEKKENLHLVSKLRAILLLEADFNAANKIIFNSRMIPSLERNNLIPQEIAGGRRN